MGLVQQARLVHEPGLLDHQRTLLLIPGSLRSGSVNAAALSTAVDLLLDGWTARLYTGLAELPAFNPDEDGPALPGVVAQLRQAIGQADAPLFSMPEYAGTLPGALKNLLDWMVGGPELTAKPVGWLNTAGAAAPTGGDGAHTALRTVLGYVNATVVEAACVRVPLPQQAIDAEGKVQGHDLRHQMRLALAALTAHVDDLDTPDP